jgi:hypothetical protein
VVFDRPQFDGLRMHPIWHSHDEDGHEGSGLHAAHVTSSKRHSVSSKAQKAEKWAQKITSRRSSRRDSFFSSLEFML